MNDRIEQGLAVAIAAQVGVGLMPGDGQAERAQAALTAIGLMLVTATREMPETNEQVSDVLSLSEKATVTIEDGVTKVLYGDAAPVVYKDGEDLSPA